MTAKTSDFVHLHVHSEYSLLDGLGRVDDLVDQAVKHGQPALALTDHGAMHGVIEFFRACKEKDIKPIIGVEAYLTLYGRKMTGKDPYKDKERHHLLLLAQNMTGYRNLLKICSAAQLEGFYYKPRIDADFLAGHSEGLICTTGCMAAEVPYYLSEEEGRPANEKLALERLHWYLDVFGPDRFFIELQEHSIPELTKINKTLLAWSQKYNVGLVVTNDVHYARPEDAVPHDTLLCVQTTSLVGEANRMKMSDQGYYLKSEAEMRALFRPLADLPESAFTNTLKIAEMCQVELEDTSYHLPDLPAGVMPAGLDYKTFLRQLTEAGLVRRYGERATGEEVVARKELELGIISQMNFDVYFLIVWDLCEFARQNNIWWNVRGSGAGSIVAYALGITMIDPLKNQLIFERFLNPDRVTMPDFDLDFPDDQREAMIRYTIEKYGRDHVAQIVSFGRMKARAAIRDVGRAQGVELSEVDKIAKLVPAIPGKPVTIDKVLTPDSEFYSAELQARYENEPQVKELIDTARNLEGVARHASIHAAAVVVTDKPLIDYVPLMRPNGAVITDSVTQFEFPICESIGLLKIDFLGLSTLTILRKATELIKERRGVEYNLDNIPIEDPQAFELLASGNVTGIFQVEGAGMRRILTSMRPSRFDHIVAVLALYRPGPMQYIPNYVARMHGEEEVTYRHPLLEPILSETYGICVSGDAIVADARTGRRYRLDEVEDVPDLIIQGVDEAWRPALGRVTRWIDSGKKPVYQLTLRNGSSIKVTADHRLLTETGWQPLSELKVGDYVATPPLLLGPNEAEALKIDRRQLRVLAYLIADGSLASMAAVDFVNKDETLLAEYQRCLSGFENVRPSFTVQVRGVTRIGIAKESEREGVTYHTPNALLVWLRELGLKAPPGSRPGGLRSHEKFIPSFVFELSQEDIAFFLASLWDCDGHIGRKICHYKTVSLRLAEEVQTLLLRLGISSTIYRAEYVTESKISRCSYQVTVYDTQRLAELLQPFMVSAKREVVCVGQSKTTLDRTNFIAEVDMTVSMSRRALMKNYGIDRQHFYKKGHKRERISADVVETLVADLSLTETNQRLNVNWQEVVSIEPMGVEHVYDLTVEGLHSFVANNIVVHNCVYQEQIMRIATDLAGYTASEADFMRKAVAKKQEKDLLKHKDKMVKGGLARGIPEQVMLDIFSDIEAFARYGFPKGHAADYAVITCQTAYLKAHYPVEYMTAMMTVEHNNTDKIGQLMDECRSMGIEVLPPNVNKSGNSFLIEDTSSGPVVRFGLGAVKNVGEGPIEAILSARGDTPFGDIDDFCQRVDLRKVGKRALESLIKVGALEDFGGRAHLLAIIDRMTQLSSSTHQAADVGQISLFDIADMNVPVTGSILNPAPEVEEIKQKVALGWEKELVGTYISAHPLQNQMKQLKEAVTCFCSDLAELRHDRRVTVAGLITKIRDTTTKKGDNMAFVEIEDTQGSLEVIVFPRTFTAYQHLLTPESLILVSGKVDAREEGRPKILADSISTELTLHRPLDADAWLPDTAPDLLDEPGETDFDNGDTAILDEPEPPSPAWVREPKTVLFIFKRSNQVNEDIQKLKTVYSLLEAHPGPDKFELCIPKNGEGVVIGYDLGIKYDSELAQKLHQLGVSVQE